MADTPDKINEVEEKASLMPPRPPSPPRIPFNRGKNLMKSPASLFGHSGASSTKSAFDVCRDFVCSRCQNDSHLEGISWLFHNNDVDACLQDGPTCGLVALKIAANIVRASGCQPGLNKPTEGEIEELLQLSKNSGFTYFGEMFSVRDLACLAKKYYNMDYEVVHSGLEDVMGLVKHVFQGYPVIVPYDSDRNNEPCLKRGHKAHWAVITGFLLGAEVGSLVKVPGNMSKEVHVYPLNPAESSIPTFLAKNLSVIARHGKSRHYALWRWSDLYCSNNNLVEFDPSASQNIQMSDFRTCLLTQGIVDGLCSKALFFHP